MFYFLVNTNGASGKAQLIWAKAKNKLDALAIQYKVYSCSSSSQAAQAAGLISQIPQSKDADKKLVVVGGDGAINAVLNGIKDFSSLKLAVLPTGSGNDFFRGWRKLSPNAVHIKAHDTNTVLNLILASRDETLIDIGLARCDDGSTHLFGISAGLGLDALVCRKVAVSKLKTLLNKISLGNLVYSLMTVITLFSMKTSRVSITSAEHGTQTYDRFIFLAAMNFACEGGGVPMAPTAQPNDSLISTCLAAGVARLSAFFKFPSLVAGKHASLKGFTLHDCTALDISTQTPLPFHTDGECLCDTNTLHIECVPHKLRVMIL